MILSKKKIKKIIPGRWIYIYKCLKKMPQYIRILIADYGEKYPDVKFMSDEETVEKIVSQGMSLSRFGDGEFMWMSGLELDSYQKYSEQFSRDLKEVFQSDVPNLLIGIPRGLFDSKECNLYAKMHWKIVKHDFWRRLGKHINLEKTYCNASITRPYIDYKRRELSKKNFENLKRIWHGRKIVIVEGEKTKLGMGNDLFDNSLSIKRILCPATDAYERINEIITSIRTNVRKDELILGALGPTATILAAKLSTEGYQFLDIGHVDIEYMWYLRKTILREPIEGKYVNESGNKEISNIYDSNREYVESIIDRII